MPRTRSPERQKAFELWIKSKGQRELKDIAAELGVSPEQVRKWKHADAWDDKTVKVTLPNGKGNVTKRREGGQPGNQNAVGNSGGGPKGNKKNLRHGAYERVMGELLEEDEAEIFDDVDNLGSVEEQLRQTLAALNAKEVRLIKRINRIKESAAKTKDMMIDGISRTVTEHPAGTFRRNEETKALEFVLATDSASGEDSEKRPPSGGHVESTVSHTVPIFDALNKLEQQLDRTQGRKIRVLAELDRIRAARERAEQVIETHTPPELELNLDLKGSGPEYPNILIPYNGRDQRPKGVLMPQAGPQTAFMASAADVVIYGGAAGGGKTFALLMEALRHREVSGFGGVIFRKNYNQITAEGGLWDASNKIFSQVPGAKAGKSPRLHWDFSGGISRLSFAYLEREEDLRSWQGTEIPYIGFDELTHFTKRQFLYMLSRNRSTCGIIPYMRATCNPDADSWVAEFIAWWIDQGTGYPIPERSGRIRWMVNLNDVISWFDTREEGVQFAIQEGLNPDEAETMPKSVTFIASSLNDNKILMEVNPGYMANLRALPLVDMERLLKGNWKIKAAAGLYFRRTQVELIPALPTDVVLWARGWDLAATTEDEDGDAAYTAGVLLGKRRNGRYVVADVINKRLSASEVRALIKMTAAADKKKYGRVIQRLPQDPGQAGKAQAQSYIKMLAGYLVKTIPESGSKESRAEPMAAQWQAGNIDVLEADWNEMYFNELESFPESKFKDMVDAGSSAFLEIENGATYSAPQESSLEKESYWRGK